MHTPVPTPPVTVGQLNDLADATRDVSPVPSWLVSGLWSQLAGAAGFIGGVYHQDDTGPYPHVTIRRYSGGAFAPGGQLPSRYRIGVAIQPFAEADHMPPIGENGVLVYYRNPTSYVELVVSGGNVSVWSADDAGPTGSAGWTSYSWFSQNTAVGDIRRLSAEVDTVAHTLSFWVEGVKGGTLGIPMITSAQGHTFALRSIGNKLNVGEIRVDDLTNGTHPPLTLPSTTTPIATPTPAPTAPPPPPASGGITFQAVASLPKGLVWHGAAVSGDTVYVSGGSNGSESFSGVWSSTAGRPFSAWQSRTSLPQPTEGHGFAVIGSYAYVIGGWGRGVGGPRTDVLKAAIHPDGSLGAWQATTPLPQGRAFQGVVVDGNRLILIGGWGPSFNAQTTVWTATANGQGDLSAWQAGPEIPAQRVWAGATIVDGTLWVTGGSSGNKTMATVFQAPYANGQIGSWRPGPDLPRPLEAQACLNWHGVLTTIGGDDYTSGTPSPTSAAFQLVNGTWRTVGNMPFAGFGQAPSVAGGRLYLCGGHDAAHNVLTGIWQGL